MVSLGYALSSEEFGPNELIQQGQRAEAAGFAFALISDHFHPWMDSEGQSPFVWSTLGGLAGATQRLRVGTGVTCPLIRIHPAIIAQAAATVAAMFGDRFFLGLGTGEYLNEHITGKHWPPIATRQAMLTEAIEVIRALWQGGYVDHTGTYYTVERARLYTLPATSPPIYIGASGEHSAELAGRLGDGLISTAPKKATIDAFVRAGGEKPCYGQMTVCWGPDEAKAAELATKQWGYVGLPGQISQELAIPLYFQEAAKIVTPELIKQQVTCGPDPARYHEQIRAYIDAGFTHIYFHQVGPDQEDFFQFAERELLPAYR